MTRLIAAIFAASVACQPASADGAAASAANDRAAVAASDTAADINRVAAAPAVAGASLDTATFAGGCFWCMEPPYDKLAGVISTTSGYMGGTVVNPTYEQVSTGRTGHTEVVQVVFDPARVSYARLLEVFWRNIDPLTPNAQFCDRGSQYRSAVFYHDSAQGEAARASKAELERSGRFRQPIVTEIAPAATFYVAEEYHQDYYTKNPVRYKYYRGSCGRDARLARLWGPATG